MKQSTYYLHAIMEVTGYNKMLYCCRNIPQFLSFLPRPYRDFWRFYRNHTATFARMTVAIPRLLVKKIATKVRPWSKIIYEAIEVFWRPTASTRPYLKACRMSKNLVRQPIFVYFHHIVALICILNHYLYLLSIVMYLISYSKP